MEKNSNNIANDVNNEQNNGSQQQFLSDTDINNIRKYLPCMRFIAVILLIASDIAAISVSIKLVLILFRGTEFITVLYFIILCIIALLTVRAAALLLASVIKLKRFIRFNNTNDLGTAFELQKKYWKSIGLFLILQITTVLIFTFLQNQ
ncbi:MAG: hypothetical protein LBS69_07100 [Prevotellaceae bacterium]|jgi:hypothetical protein|nr:hypothetical protein [Prevotellaceae bacterium]